MKRRALAIAFGLGLISVVFGITEIVLRRLGPPDGYSQGDSLTKWSLRPGFAGPGPDLPDVPLTYTIRINDAGFRGGPIQPTKPPRTFRLAALGDSVTFGFGVSEEAALPARMAALLAVDVPTSTVEAINAGVPGFTSFQGLHHLDRSVLPLGPDLVTVFFGWNDGWRSVVPDAAPPRNLGPVDTVIDSSRVLTVTRRKFQSLMRRIGLQSPAESRVRVPRVPPESFEANLVKMAEHIRKAGAVPVFITAPAAFGPDRPPDSYFMNDWMVPRTDLEPTRALYAEATRRAAKAAGVLLVDCARLVPADPGLFLADGYHPNQAGFQVIAQQIAAAVRRATLIPRGLQPEPLDRLSTTRRR